MAHHKPISYARDAPLVNMVTNGCATGIAGVISQGDNWKSAKVAAFYLAKLTPTPSPHSRIILFMK
jgi:hypothetical protein